MSKTLARLMMAALAVTLVVACGGAQSATSGPAGTSSGGGYPGTTTGSNPKSITGPAAPAPNGAQDVVKPGIAPSDVVPPIGEGPRVVRTAQVAVEVKNGSFDGTLDRLFTISTSLGGYISGSVANADSGALRTGTITFLVPADKFSEAISQVRALGTVQNLAIGGQDVSAQYVDLQARLKNSEAQRDAMLALLGQARTVAEIIAVQTQLGNITGQIEQLKGQIAYYDHATSYSTVSVSIHEAAVALKPASTTDSWGIKEALLQGLHGFVNTLDFLLVGVGYAGPILVLLVLAFAAWRLRRRFAM